MSSLFPLKMTENRVYRIYLGGALLDELRGSTPEDGYFPEDWLASVVLANNPPHENQHEFEGLSKVKLPGGTTAYLKDLIEESPESFLGEEHIEDFGIHFGVLTKFLDSAERLPVQVHPDKKAARELFNSDYGKTEAWYILGGRKIDGEEPYILLGFKQDVSPQQLKELFDAQDIKGMEALMHKIPVKPGEVYLITGGTPHAIGPGCFLLEIQEPTDYTISLEKSNTLGEKLPDFMCHQGLGFERMFDCFNYINYSEKALLDAFRLTPKEIATGSGADIRQIIGYEHTPCFALNEYSVKKSFSHGCLNKPSALVVVAGEGKIAGEDVKAGDCLFVPATAEPFEIISKGADPLRVLECLPPANK